MKALKAELHTLELPALRRLRAGLIKLHNGVKFKTTECLDEQNQEKSRWHEYVMTFWIQLEYHR